MVICLRFAFITYCSKDSAKRALATANQENLTINGRKLRVQPKKRKSSQKNFVVGLVCESSRLVEFYWVDQIVKRYYQLD